MNAQHKAIRATLQTMAPNRAKEYIAAFDLPAYEEIVLVECDVHRKSYTQVAQAFSMSPETIKRCRQSAFAHIADELNNPA